MKYNCSACQGDTPCCWENPATYVKVAEAEERVSEKARHGPCPPDVARRWRWRWWPLHIRVHSNGVSLYWYTLARAHRGLQP